MFGELSTRDKVLVVWTFIDMVMYSITLVYAIHNTVKYIVIQKRCHNFFLVDFYVLTILISATRIVFFICECKQTDQVDLTDGYWFWRSMSGYSGLVSFTLKSLLGVAQVGLMVKLVINIKKAEDQFSHDEAKKKLKTNTVLVCITKAVLVFLGAVSMKAKKEHYDYLKEANNFKPEGSLQWFELFIDTYYLSVLLLLSVALSVVSI